MVKDANKTALYIMGIVALVAAVAVFNSFLGYLHDTQSEKNVAGEAVSAATSSSKWTACLDQGNKIKLTNAQASLIKGDSCLPDDTITHVSCSEDAFGYFTYLYSPAQSCSQGKSCLKDSSGIGYCG